MKKVIKKKKEEVVTPEEEETKVQEFCESCEPVKKIDKLTGIGGNTDFNKVVEKINELVDKANDSI